MNQVLTAAGTFWLFSVVSLGHLYFTYTTVPETKGKTLEEIEAYLVKFASIPLQVSWVRVGVRVRVRVRVRVTFIYPNPNPNPNPNPGR